LPTYEKVNHTLPFPDFFAFRSAIANGVLLMAMLNLLSGTDSHSVRSAIAMLSSLSNNVGVLSWQTQQLCFS